MIRTIHCWWCGKLAEVDTNLNESGGMIRDSDTSWICDANHEDECAAQAFAKMLLDEHRNKVHDHSLCRLEESQ